MKPVAKKVNRRERLLPVKNEPCFEIKAILSGRCPSGDRGRGRVGSEIELCSATFLREVAHLKSSLTGTVTLVEIEDSHSMLEVDKAVTQTAPVAESRKEAGADADTRADCARAVFRQNYTMISSSTQLPLILINFYQSSFHLHYDLSTG